jgi:hypothetical protein
MSMSNKAEENSIDLVDATSLRLSKALAIADLIMECKPGALSKHTLSNAAGLLIDLLGDTKDLITGKMEVQS